MATSSSVSSFITLEFYLRMGKKMRRIRSLVRVSLAFSFVFSMVLIASIVSAEDSLSYPNLAPGPIVGITFHMDGNHTFETIINGSGQQFNVFIGPAESYAKAINNESFAYYQEYSMLNVTYADINFSLPTGIYTILVQNLQRGDVTIRDPVMKSGAIVENGISIPWEIIGTIAITSVVTASITYMVVTRKKK